MDMGSFAKNFALNVGQDVGMDVASYRAGKATASQGQQKIGPKTERGFSLTDDNQSTSKSSISQELGSVKNNGDTAANIRYTDDGQAVKTNQDGIASRLSDAELAKKSTETATRSLGTEQPTIRTAGNQNEAVNSRIDTNLEQGDNIRQQNTINPIRDNGVARTKATRNELETLLTRANSGDTEAMRILKEYGYESENAEQQIGWRPKTVEEVIRPEEQRITADSQTPENALRPEAGDQTPIRNTDTPEQRLNQTQKTPAELAEENRITNAKFDELSPTDQAKWLEIHDDQIMSENQLRDTLRAMNIDPTGMSRLDMLRAYSQTTNTPTARVESAEDALNAERINNAQTNEMADIEPILKQRTDAENMTQTTADTRLSDTLANMGSETETRSFGEKLVDNVQALNDVLMGRDRQPAYATINDEYSYPSKATAKNIRPGGELDSTKNFSIYKGQDGKNAVKIDDPTLLKDTPVEKYESTIRRAILEKFQGEKIKIGDTDETALVSGKSAGKISRRGGAVGDDAAYRNKGEASQQLDELINNLHNIRTEPNNSPTTNGKKNVRSVTKGEIEVDINGQKLYPTVVIRNYNDGTSVVHEISDIKRTAIGSTEPVGRNNFPMDGGSESSNNSSIPQGGETVNAKSSFAENTSQNRNFSTETKQTLKNDPLSYKPTTNEERLARANEILSTKSIDEIDSYLRENFFNVKPKDTFLIIFNRILE